MIEEQTIKNIFAYFCIAELKNNMRNTKTVAKAAKETPNPNSWYLEGLEPLTIHQNQGETVGAILQQAFEHLQNYFMNLLILLLKEDLESSYQAVNKAANYAGKSANKKNIVCLYGTSDQPNATTIPETSDRLFKQIVISSSLWFHP